MQYVKKNLFRQQIKIHWLKSLTLYQTKSSSKATASTVIPTSSFTVFILLKGSRPFSLQSEGRRALGRLCLSWDPLVRRDKQ